MDINSAIRLADVALSKQSNIDKAYVLDVMNSVDKNSSWEEQNKAARFFLDNKDAFSNEEIIQISKDFISRTGFKPKN